VNEAKYTYDGIDICGERAAQQVRIKKKECFMPRRRMITK
jgi:hypothetical protein